MSKPIGISGFKINEALPDQLQGSLPTIEDLEAELATPSDDAEDEQPSGE